MVALHPEVLRQPECDHEAPESLAKGPSVPAPSAVEEPVNDRAELLRRVAVPGKPLFNEAFGACISTGHALHSGGKLVAIKNDAASPKRQKIDPFSPHVAQDTIRALYGKYMLPEILESDPASTKIKMPSLAEYELAQKRVNAIRPLGTVTGFVDPTDGTVYIHPQKQRTTTVHHELLHKHSSPNAFKGLDDHRAFEEGFTAILEREVAEKLGLDPNSANAYTRTADWLRNWQSVEKVDRELFMKAYFQGDIEGLNKALHDKNFDWWMPTLSASYQVDQAFGPSVRPPAPGSKLKSATSKP